MPIAHRRARIVFTLSASLLISFALMGPTLIGVHEVRADAVFVVNSTADPGDGTCNVSECTLREALTAANATAGVKTITFDLAAPPNTILLTGGQLNVTGDDITLDGPGATNLILQADPAQPSTTHTLRVTGSRNTIQHMTLSGARGEGIQIYTLTSGGASDNLVEDVIIVGGAAIAIDVIGTYELGGSNNRIHNSLIGAASWSATACDVAQRNVYGIAVSGLADGTILEGNRVVCNASIGLYLASAGTNGTTVRNNSIGTDGTHAMGNGAWGIYDWQTIGTEISGNTIASNGNIGLWTRNSNGTAIKGNKIGTNASGTVALPNINGGISVDGQSQGTVIGDATDPAARNIVSGNTGPGIMLGAVPSSGNGPVVNGNIIGLNASGTAALPNTTTGIVAGGTLPVTIGEDGASVDQLISGNGGDGIYFGGPDGLVFGSSNYVGVGADHTTALGNGDRGIWVLYDARHATVTPSVVAYNGGAGIAVSYDTPSQILIRPATVHSNGGLAIDLGDDGPTYNDLGDLDTGPNGRLNYPEITSASGHDLAGTACLGCFVFVYDAIGDPTASGGGGTYLLQVQADPGTGAWEATLPGALTAWDVTLVASESPSPGNTSEMSLLYTAPHFQLFLPLVLRNFP